MVAAKLAGILLALTATAGAATADAAGLRGLIAFDGRNVKWGAPAYGAGAEITYAFLDRALSSPGARNCSEMLPVRSLTKRSLVPMDAFRNAVRDATAAWSAVAPISFREVGEGAEADILIGAQRGDGGVAFTNVSRDDRAGSVSALTQALICLDPSERWAVAWDGDPATYDLPRVLVHEIGHAIGLDHLGRDGGVMGYAYTEQKELRLSEADVAAVTRLYGTLEAPLVTSSSDPAPIIRAGTDCVAMVGAMSDCEARAPATTSAARILTAP